MAATELKPLLKLVETARVRFHENPEGGRTDRLKQRIASDAFLKNPPIVADMGGGDYLLLDGANRVSVFRELGYSHIPVQVVDYGDKAVQLKGWHHLLVEAQALDLRGHYAALPGVKLAQVRWEDLAHILELRQVFAVLVEDHDSCWGLFPEDGNGEIEMFRRIEVMHGTVDGYEGRSRLERIKLADYSLLPDVVGSVEHQLALFPTLHKGELLHAASKGVMMPTGLTRHIIPGRALGLNLDLGFLTDGSTPAQMQAHFQAFTDKLAMDGRIRYYEESVFIMNE